MKTKVAMAISLSGVLAAGTAAALVNTQVLNGGSSGAPLAAAPDVHDSVPSSGGTAGAPSVTIGSDIPVAAPSPTQATYAIGEAGTVTLDTANGVLSIVAATPAQGWVVSQSESDGSGNAEVKFQSADQEVEFHANLLYGVVNTSIEGSAGSDEMSGDDGATHDSVSGHDSDDDHGDDQRDDERGDDD